MPATFDFPPFDIQLLKLAAERASSVAKAAKKAASNAYLTEAESEAHELEGYADEAVRFLDNGSFKAKPGDDDAAEDDATDDDDSAPDAVEGDPRSTSTAAVELSTGHRRALRVGCLILIKESEKIIDKQEEMFADTDGQGRRMNDFRRLEQRLRSDIDPQRELDMPAKGDATTPATADAAPEEDAPTDEGPFDAPAVPPRLALVSGESAPEAPEIPDADFEFLENDADDEDGAALSLVPDNDGADDASEDDANRVE